MENTEKRKPGRVRHGERDTSGPRASRKARTCLNKTRNRVPHAFQRLPTGAQPAFRICRMFVSQRSLRGRGKRDIECGSARDMVIERVRRMFIESRSSVSTGTCLFQLYTNIVYLHLCFARNPGVSGVSRAHDITETGSTRVDRYRGSSRETRDETAGESRGE